MPVILYKKQRQIVDFLSQYIQRYGYSPTLKEIAEAIGVSSLATVHEHLNTLQKKGVIKRYEGAVRGLELLDGHGNSTSGAVNLPILGYFTAGQPIEPYAQPNATLGVAPAIVSGRARAYVLHVKGNSLIDEGILNADYIVIEETDEVKNGEIVVALLENGLATLKKFFKEATRVRLESVRGGTAPIFVTSVKIQGRAVSVIRNY